MLKYDLILHSILKDFYFQKMSVSSSFVPKPSPSVLFSTEPIEKNESDSFYR